MEVRALVHVSDVSLRMTKLMRLAGHEQGVALGNPCRGRLASAVLRAWTDCGLGRRRKSVSYEFGRPTEHHQAHAMTPHNGSGANQAIEVRGLLSKPLCKPVARRTRIWWARYWPIR